MQSTTVVDSAKKQQIEHKKTLSTEKITALVTKGEKLLKEIQQLISIDSDTPLLQEILQKNLIDLREVIQLCKNLYNEKTIFHLITPTIRPPETNHSEGEETWSGWSYNEETEEIKLSKKEQQLAELKKNMAAKQANEKKYAETEKKCSRLDAYNFLSTGISALGKNIAACKTYFDNKPPSFSSSVGSKPRKIISTKSPNQQRGSRTISDGARFFSPQPANKPSIPADKPSIDDLIKSLQKAPNSLLIVSTKPPSVRKRGQPNHHKKARSENVGPVIASPEIVSRSNTSPTSKLTLFLNQSSGHSPSNSNPSQHTRPRSKSSKSFLRKTSKPIITRKPSIGNLKMNSSQ